MIDMVLSVLTSGVSAAILSGNLGVDKKLLANKEDIMTGWYRFLYSCPEAIAVSERLNQLLIQVNFTLYSLSVNFQYIFS